MSDADQSYENPAYDDNENKRNGMIEPDPDGSSGDPADVDTMPDEPEKLSNGSIDNPVEDNHTPEPSIHDDYTPTEAHITMDDEEEPNMSNEDKRMQEIERKRKREVLHFDSDPSKRIDYVLAYTDKYLNDPKRLCFEKYLKKEGVELETQDKSDSTDGKTSFVKIHVPWDTLCDVAELLYMPKRIKVPKELEEKEGCCTCTCTGCCTVGEPVVHEEDDYFTAEFEKDNIDMFEVDVDDEESKAHFFTNAERSLLAREILARTSYTNNEQDSKFGINRLLRDGVYIAAYPLHEGTFKPIDPHANAKDILSEEDNYYDKDRMRLYEAWARPGAWWRYQPLDLIRKYFGEKIGIYFAWLGFYTAMLIPAALVGTGVFAYGVVSMIGDVPSDDVCTGAPSKLVMCPLCDHQCDYFPLEDSCIYSKITHVFDNIGTVVYSVFMAVWATVFLEFWKRKQKTLEFDWDVAEFELEEPVRPEFEHKVTTTRYNPITQQDETYMPFYKHFPRMCTSFVVVLFMICLVLGAIFGVIVYRITVSVLIYKAEPNEIIASLGTTISASLINLVAIVILNFIYQRIAEWLTDLECPRTTTEYEDSFTFKMFLFQFVNFYGTIFYIAFFKGRFSLIPGDTTNYLFGKYRQDACYPSGCIVDLFIQLAVVMVGKQTLNNFKEIIIPKMLTWFHTRSSKKGETDDNLYMRWEQDKDLAPQPKLGLFEEYLEMVVQFGFVTIFVAAFPLGPLFALMNNVTEIRLDAYKFVCVWQRAPAMKAQDIGIWFGILKAISYLSVLTNALIIGWTSDFVPKMVYYFMYADYTLEGYVANGLTEFATADYVTNTGPDPGVASMNATTCWFRGYYNSYDYVPASEKYEYTRQFWEVLAARLAFILVFEHAVFLLTVIVSTIIPDMPSEVRLLQQYERELIKKRRFDAHMGDNFKVDEEDEE